jgi:hypothetical protein
MQVQGYNCNKTKRACINANTTSIKTKKNAQKSVPMSKNGKHELHAIVYAKETQVKIYMLLPSLRRPLSKTIVVIYHAMCLLISC